MNHRSLLIIGVLSLTACAPIPSHQMGGSQNQAGFLPGQGVDIASLPEAKTSSIMDVQDGQTISLDPTIVRNTIGGKKFAMYGYNGQIPGPLLRVKQGSTFTVNITNGIDLPTSIHWHGLRLDNANDGAVGVTQREIAPGDNYTYTVKVPDEGIYWYHTHVREDLQQPMGLYGNILVTPADAQAYNPVNREEVLTVSDLLLDENGQPAPFQKESADHLLMGRFGNTMLVNGSTDYSLSVAAGSVVRFYLTDTANTRTFKIDFGGAAMKLVGGDNGRYEREQSVKSVTLSPSERAIVDVLFEKSGTFEITHRTPYGATKLGTVSVAADAASPSYSKQFADLTAHDDVARDIDAFRPFFDKDIDHTLVLDMGMGHGGMQGGMMGDVPKDGIEWEDNGMGAMPMPNMMKWQMVDEATGKANMDLVYTAKVGDKLKLRIVNKKDSPHPMQHPIHFHGQRFLVLSDNGVPTENFVWKDTVLVPAGHTVDILLDVSNPGDWMFHCHIAEHLGNGMMGLLSVQP